MHTKRSKFIEIYPFSYLLLNEIVHEMFPDLKGKFRLIKTKLGNNLNDDGDYWKQKLNLNDIKNIKID